MPAMSVLVRSRVARFTFPCGSLSNLPFRPRTRACATPNQDDTFSSANRATSIGCRYAKVWFNYSTMASLNACFADFSEDAIDYEAADVLVNSKWRLEAVDKPFGRKEDVSSTQHPGSSPTEAPATKLEQRNTKLMHPRQLPAPSPPHQPPPLFAHASVRCFFSLNINRRHNTCCTQQQESSGDFCPTSTRRLLHARRTYLLEVGCGVQRGSPFEASLFTPTPPTEELLIHRCV